MAGHERHPSVARRLFGAAGDGHAPSEARAEAVFVTRLGGVMVPYPKLIPRKKLKL